MWSMFVEELGFSQATEIPIQEMHYLLNGEIEIGYKGSLLGDLHWYELEKRIFFY